MSDGKSEALRGTYFKNKNKMPMIVTGKKTALNQV